MNGFIVPLQILPLCLSHGTRDTVSRGHLKQGFKFPIVPRAQRRATPALDHILPRAMDDSARSSQEIPLYSAKVHIDGLPPPRTLNTKGKIDTRQKIQTAEAAARYSPIYRAPRKTRTGIARSRRAPGRRYCFPRRAISSSSAS